MKKYAFKGLGLVLAAALIVGCFAGCAKINYVTDGAIQAINEVAGRPRVRKTPRPARQIMISP